MISKLSLAGIWFYQTFISPRKGYSCAYRVANGGPGCSGFAKEKIREIGLFGAMPLIRQRFKDCSTAAEGIRQRRRKPGRGCRNEEATCDCDPLQPDITDGCGDVPRLGKAQSSSCDDGCSATCKGCDGCACGCDGF